MIPTVETKILDNRDLKILCIDDEEDILEILAQHILTAGFTPIKISSPKEAIEVFKKEIGSIALILCDYKMEEMSGFEFRKCIFPERINIPFTIISAYITKEMLLEGLELEISSFLDKPVNEKDLIDRIYKDSANRVQYLREAQTIQNIFIEESVNMLDEIESALLSLEHDRLNTSVIKVIAREIHTLKGSSGCLDTNIITKYVHKYEDIIQSLQKEELALDDDVYSVLFLGFDRIKELVSSILNKTVRDYKLEELLPELDLKKDAKKSDNLKKKLDHSSVSSENITPKKDAPKQVQKESISVPTSMLDELSNFSGEITVLRNMINKIVRSLETQYTGNKEIQNLGELLDEMHKINSTIQTRIVDLRKVPLSQSLKSIPRIIHDLCNDLGKKINLNIEGENLRVDNSLTTVCSNSIVHLIRNSVDHGIELPQERLKLNKSESGSIFIRCIEEHDEVLIKIRDDGHGIDYHKIKAKALEKGIHTESELAQMTEKQILGIIFSSGFSTAAKITDVSGRGVGMDMVKSSVDHVGGQIDIDTQIGKGTTFTLKLPVPKSVLIINSLLIESGQRCFAIPQDSIVRILRIEQEQARNVVSQISNGFILQWNDTIYPLLNLETVLCLENEKKQSEKFLNSSVLEILIVRSEHFIYALLVDSIFDSEEIVVKKIPQYFKSQSIYAGATFMGDGSIGLILDVNGVAEIAGIKSSDHLKNEAIEEGKKIYKSIKNDIKSEFVNYILFNLGTKTVYGVPLNQIFRLEEIEGKKIQYSGAQEVFLYRDELMPVYSLDNLLKIPNKKELSNNTKDKIPIIVTKGKQGVIGLKVSQVVDIVESEKEILTSIRDRIGITGNVFLREQTVTILDLPTVLQSLKDDDRGDLK
jgi:two-component system chemotaxis sensor kinase CheA